MTFPFILFALALLAFGYAGAIIRRHWNDIRLLDPLTIKEEQHRQKRELLIRKRFDRLRDDQLKPFRRFWRGISKGTQEGYDRLYRKLQSFELAYQNARNPFSSMTPTVREQVKLSLTEARSFMRDLKWGEAERRFLDVLALDPRQVDAYKGLGQIYLKQRLYPQAQETFAFIIKMKKADDATYAALAEIEEETTKDLQKAEAYRLKAVDMSPKQAFRHAELADFYLRQEQLAKAWPEARKASELEPNSAKYMELVLELAVKLGDTKEARQRYNKLRLLSDDRSKFQYWRDKVEALEREASSAVKPATKTEKKPRARKIDDAAQN